jgi:glycosyltransferase involved in cell wall biosynthesis
MVPDSTDADVLGRVADGRPYFSVVMAAFNYGRFIAEAMRSVTAQTFADWELIVVDDGSTDDTPDVVRPFLADPRIRYHRHENRGQPATENVGVGMARGDWIAFLDADDRWFPEKLARQVSLIERNPSVSVVYGELMLMDPNGNPLPTPLRTQYRGYIVKELFRQNEIPFSTAVVRRSVIEEVGGFNAEYRHANDYDLWLRVAASGHAFDFVPEPLVWYRTGHPNLSSRGDVQLGTALTIMDRFVDAYPDLLQRRWIDRCYSETYCHLGMVFQAKGLLLSASRWYMRSLRRAPTNREALSMLLRLCLPKPAVAFIKRVARLR